MSRFDADEGHADDEDDEAREIELESARIQREIVKERVNKMSTPTKKSNQTSPKFTDRVVGKKHQLKELDDSMQKAREDKQVLMRELKAMKEKLRRHQVDIKMAEKQAKENRTKAEDARTELMLTEFKRDSAKKELEKVMEEINRKKKKAKGIDEKIKAMNKESKDLESMGITKEEVIMIVAENEELQAQARNAHTTELERNELLRQLECTKEELFAEQKRARSRVEALEEEIEIAAHKHEQSQVERENLHKQLEILDAKYKQAEQEKNNLIEAKSSELNTLQDQTQKQVLNVRKQTNREVTELKQKIVTLNEKVGTLRAEISQKDQMSIHLREQVVQLQQELTRETEMKEQLIEENQRNMKTMRSDKDNAITKLKEVAMADKQQSLEELRVMLEKEMNNALTRSDERLTGTITEHQKTVQTKDQEIYMLRERVKSQETATRQLGEKLRAESQENTRSAISKEKEMWEREKNAEIQRRVDNVREDYSKSLDQKRADLEAEKQTVGQLRKQLANLSEELEDQKCHNRLQYQERTIAINKVKEDALIEKEADLNRLQDKLRKERNAEQDSLKEQLRKQEEEITQLHSELQRLRLKDQETNSLLERQEKTMVQEINEECRKISTILGVTPRTATLSKSPARTGNNRASQMSVTTSALANLKACDEELRHYVEELKQEIQSLKQTITRLHRDKDHLEEMSKLHQNVGKDKNAQQLLREKDRELREIQRSMSTWKEGTAEKLAKKFEEELNRELEKRLKEQKRQKREYERLSSSQQREIDRYKREVQRLGNINNSHSGLLNVSSASASPVIEDASTVRLLQQLQGRVKQLRSENTALKMGGLSSSVPDLANVSYSTSPTRDSSLNRMESKINALERKSQMAEERAEKNQQMLTGKITEISKLQNTLTQQTKELMQLERAYSQLKQQSVGRSPSSRLTSVR